jgi:hypothetical protein
MSDRFLNQRALDGQGVVYVSEMPIRPHPKRLFAYINDPLGRLYDCAGQMSNINPAYIDAKYEMVFYISEPDAYKIFSTR